MRDGGPGGGTGAARSFRSGDRAGGGGRDTTGRPRTPSVKAFTDPASRRQVRDTAGRGSPKPGRGKGLSSTPDPGNPPLKAHRSRHGGAVGPEERGRAGPGARAALLSLHHLSLRARWGPGGWQR